MYLLSCFYYCLHGCYCLLDEGCVLRATEFWAEVLILLKFAWLLWFVDFVFVDRFEEFCSVCFFCWV